MISVQCLCFFTLAVGDYESVPATHSVTFEPSQSCKTVSVCVPIINDDVEEEVERFGLLLTPTTEGAIAIENGSAIVEIYDDDRKLNLHIQYVHFPAGLWV